MLMLAAAGCPRCVRHSTAESFLGGECAGISSCGLCFGGVKQRMIAKVYMPSLEGQPHCLYFGAETISPHSPHITMLQSLLEVFTIIFVAIVNIIIGTFVSSIHATCTECVALCCSGAA